jgi:tartrate dehydratase beta subunit/fumarate hydratase class I family protein
MWFAFSMVSLNGCSTVNSTSTNTDQIEAEILDAFKGLVEASKALDSSRYFEYIDKEKFTGLGADGKVWRSVKNLEDVILSGFPMVDKIISLEFQNVKVTVVNPSTAILVNEYKQTILLKDKSVVKQAGGGTQVWSKSGNAWKLVSISSSDASQLRDQVF